MQDDGSETLSLRLNGIPAGVFPTSNISDKDAISYLGGGSWNIRLDAVPTLTLPTNPNYAGENPYPDFEIIAVTQEKDGDEATSDPWTVEFNIFPVVDGFSSWDLDTTVTEDFNEVTATGISLATLLDFNLIDDTDIGDNPAEVPLDMSFDLSNLLDDAQIRQRARNVLGFADGDPPVVIQDLINGGLIPGFYSFDNNTEIITANIADVAGISLASTLFFQSNIDFRIPVTLRVRDEATIDGVVYQPIITYTGEFRVDLRGTADTPIVSADNAAGFSLTNIPLNLFGEITDSDVSLLRNASESIYFVVTEIASSGMPFDYAVGLLAR